MACCDPIYIVTGLQHSELFNQSLSIGPCQHTIRNQDLMVPLEGFEDGLTGRSFHISERGRRGAASFYERAAWGQEPRKSSTTAKFPEQTKTNGVNRPRSPGVGPFYYW